MAARELAEADVVARLAIRIGSVVALIWAKLASRQHFVGITYHRCWEKRWGEE